MKLSEAILKGCEGTIQYFGDYRGINPLQVCALGAALIGFDRPDLLEITKVGTEKFILEEFLLDRKGIVKFLSDLQNIFVICPEESKEDTLWEIIPKLNDDYKWPREKIAKWLQEQGL